MAHKGVVCCGTMEATSREGVVVQRVPQCHMCARSFDMCTYTGYICVKWLWYGQRSQGDWPFVCKSRILNVFVLPQLSYFNMFGVCFGVFVWVHCCSIDQKTPISNHNNHSCAFGSWNHQHQLNQTLCCANSKGVECLVCVLVFLCGCIVVL